VVAENIQGVVLSTVVKRLELAEDQMDGIAIVEICISLRSSVNARDGNCRNLLESGKHRSHRSYVNRIYPMDWIATPLADLECRIRQWTMLQLRGHR